MHRLTPALVYFLIVFGAGFALGTIRVLFILPLLSERAAELLEMPLMLTVIVIAAQWITRQYLQDAQPWEQLAVGLMATGYMLAAEFLVGITLRGLSPAEVVVNRDPVAGTGYYLSLMLFAVMPWLLARRQLRQR
ncbi:MAG: hypothetical protein H8J66_00035 [Nitrospira sp.]|nr:hypothetical protein [Nitrospira sp.]